MMSSDPSSKNSNSNDPGASGPQLQLQQQQQQHQHQHQHIEEYANDIVGLIKDFIDIVRLEFSPTKKSNITDTDTNTSGIIKNNNAKIYSHLINVGYTNRLKSILQKHNHHCHSHHHRHHHHTCEDKEENEENAAATNINSDNDECDERLRLVNEIFYPLIISLTDCYRKLDQIIDNNSSNNDDDEEDNNNNNKQCRNETKRQRQSKPKPPVGLLSLQNYTDIACLLEMMICTSILFHLESGILTSIEDRIKYHIPKSLMGRLPKAALCCWSTNNSNYCNNHGERNDDESIIHNNHNRQKKANELIESASVITDLILLDRFRPMLLPRHLSDLYASIFQAEQLLLDCNCPTITSTTSNDNNNINMDNNNNNNHHHLENKLSTLYSHLGINPVAKDESSPSSSSSSPPPTSIVVDPIIQAKSYQLLLLQGTKGPAWVRKRISPLLFDLACMNLIAIVQVFVPSSSSLTSPSSSGRQQQLQEDTTNSACQRLGHTLAMSSRVNPSRLIPQILMCLQSIYPSSSSRVEIPVKSISIINTVWAILRNWPSNAVKRIFTIWEQDLTNTKTATTSTTNIHATIRQVGGLVAICPPSSGTILQWFLPSHTLIFNCLVRLASLPTNKISLASSSHYSIKEDARQTLYWLSRAMIAEDGTKLDAPSILAVVWVHAICPSISWDMQGYQYKLMLEDDYDSSIMPSKGSPSSSMVISKSQQQQQQQQQQQLEQVSIIKENNDIIDFATIVDGTTERVNTFVEVLMQNIVSQQKQQQKQYEIDPDDDREKDRLTELPSRMFQLLLRIYLSSAAKNQQPEEKGNCWDSYQVVAIVLLPMLCERCSPESLLFGDSKDATGLLNLLKLILVCTNSKQVDSANNNNVQSCVRVANTNNMPITQDCSMLHSLEQIQKALKKKSSSSGGDDEAAAASWLSAATASGSSDEDNDNESLLSIASIVLGLLISVLELGSKLRSPEEESILQSLLPILEPLAQITATSSSTASQETEAGLADMSSYAMVLIASRTVQGGKENDVGTNAPTISKLERIRAIIAQAERDLQSSQPPIRAKGMVSLGRLARAYAGIIPKEKVATPLVVEIDQEKEDITTPEEEMVTLLVQEILRLSVIGLADSESYVYLAAIQTIVAIGDMRPKQTISLVAASMSSGVLSREGKSTRLTDCDTNGTTDDDIIQLSDEQRIKLAEALMFIIRRRATTVEFVSEIFTVMIYGSAVSGERIGDQKQNGGNGGLYDSKQAMEIQNETHNYFLHLDEDVLQQEKKQQWEEQDIRLRTGGPVFESEEADLVRAARVSVVAELVSVSKPSTIAPYCRLALRLVIDILSLEKSRAVCRSASLLARELFGCLLGEHEELADMVDNPEGSLGSSSPLPFAVAMVCSDEKVLVSVLEKIVAHEQGENSINDSATASRCKEALALRQEAEDEGIFSVAQMLIRRGEECNNIPSLLNSMTSQNTAGNIVEINVVETLGK